MNIIINILKNRGTLARALSFLARYTTPIMRVNDFERGQENE